MFSGELTKLAVTFEDVKEFFKFGDLFAIRCYIVGTVFG